ncbi:MAG: DPP IV N-terminal domain-containing protein, partial [Acidobacteria bacterium]|nr:DPP IV N-terminal domain-containing protein [Acidobacteriota bacterium]
MKSALQRLFALPVVLMLVFVLLDAQSSKPSGATQDKPFVPQGGTQGKKPLKLEEIFSEAGLTGRMPTQMRWSPDGKRLTYILQEDEGERRDLWVVEAETGEKRVLVSYEQLSKLAPPAEQLAQDERERERLLRYAVAAYVWAPDSKQILFTSAGRLYLYDLASGESKALAQAKRGVGDPKFSPDGRWISFVYQHDLWLVPTALQRQGYGATGEEKRLTTGGSELVLHGELDWVYPEEFGIRTGYEWSPDSRRIAFLELDQQQVPTYPISDLVPIDTPVDFQRYPKAGDPNPRARVGVVSIEWAERSGASVTEVQWLDRAAEYTPRFGWIDAGLAWVQLLDRAQRELELVAFDVESGKSKTLLVERDPHWINITDDFAFLPERDELLWASERTGYNHFYLYGLDGQLKRTVDFQVKTKANWEVTRLEGVDEKAGWVYFTSTERNVLGSDLYRVKLDGSGVELLTKEPGTHAITMNGAATAYVDSHSALGRPPEMRVHHLPSGKVTVMHQAKPVDGYEMVKPELLELKAPDGALVRGLLLKPREEPVKKGRKVAAKKYPVVMYVYGGPHSATIRDSWGGRIPLYLFHQYLAQQGFVVMYVDDRASSILGHKHEAALHRNLGLTALADHRVAVEWLKTQPFVDPERIAIWGWSGGGFSTCMALTHSDLFKVGIAGAPVTDHRLYDTIYTERYMGLPQEEKEAYDATSCVKAAGNLSGRLLLIH